MDLTHRPRRLRRNAPIRSLVRETLLAPQQLIYPLFVAEGSLLEEQLDDCDREGEDVVGAHLFARETGVVFCARLEHVGRGLLGREHVQILRAYGCGLHLRFSDGLCEFCGLVVADLVEDLVVVGDLLKDIGRFYIAMAYAESEQRQ